MQTTFVPKVVGAQIKLPARWNELIAQADSELGEL
jgi:hypothetical protein